MRAVVLPEHGDIDVLQIRDDRARPAAGPGRVVLRVGASSLNYHDIFTVRGMPGITIPMPVVPGIDVAGRIVEVGEGVAAEWAVGDRVVVMPWLASLPELGLIGEVYDGGLQQYVEVDARLLIRLPDDVSEHLAAALPVAYGTAHRMVIGKGAIRAGDRVLVLGASGGVGVACVQLAKRLGAHVVAAVGSEEKGRALLALGADEVLNYREEDIFAWVVEHHGKPSRFDDRTGMNVVINFTGGDTWRPTLKSTALGGRILTCGATAGYAPEEDLRYIWTYELQVIGSNGYGPEDIVALLADVSEGRLEPCISDVLPLSQTVEGLRRIRDREVIGKILIDPWGDEDR
ncbi:zinc-binding dehydrogenase [Leucobacter sp. UCD-THU]|uniref:zinc-binding dehydrogenase n=1 Tax=Leucobacter sp. UCD-THU TaxID=1292023 RepID=UPI00036FE850|nr:zinc-binding dehydrogenase [Leucobacter sp. UCD-THU]EYT52065.1 zinc-binding dehydrogenase [Leucobacter sp. UCD-THU]